MDTSPARTLLAAVYRGDGAAALAVLTGNGRQLLQSMPQLAGDAVLCAIAQHLPSAQQLATDLSVILRQRGWDGDVELADQLDPALSDAIEVPLRPLRIDLEELSAILEGGLLDIGGRIDLTTGDVWPQAAVDYAREIGSLEEDEDEEDDDAARWLWVDGEGSRAAYHDMAEFITTIADHELAHRLDRAIHGKGAFGRFKNQLAHHTAEFDHWMTFSTERQRGRARQWLADQGYRPAPSRNTRPDNDNEP